MTLKSRLKAIQKKEDSPLSSKAREELIEGPLPSSIPPAPVVEASPKKSDSVAPVAADEPGPRTTRSSPGSSASSGAKADKPATSSGKSTSKRESGTTQETPKAAAKKTEVDEVVEEPSGVTELPESSPGTDLEGSDAESPWAAETTTKKVDKTDLPSSHAPKIEKKTFEWEFEEEGDKTSIGSGYKVIFVENAPGVLKFTLKGKETKTLSVSGLDEPCTATVDSDDGPLMVTVTSRGLEKGKLKVEIEKEGGKANLTKASETTKKATEKSVSFLSRHTAQIATGTLAVTTSAVFLLAGGESLREAMGSALYYIGGIAIPALGVVLETWRVITIRQEDKKSETSTQKVN